MRRKRSIGKSEPGQHFQKHLTIVAANRAPKKIASITPRAQKHSTQTSDPSPSKTKGDLRAQLSGAEARIEELEARLALVADRIAWIADRLHSLLEDKE